MSLNITGCIQHRFLSIIKLDGSVSHTYEAIGDSADLYDNNITLPKGFWWDVETEIIQDSSGNPVHIHRARMNLRSPSHLPAVYAPESTHCPEIFLRHPIYFKRVDALFGVVFIFKQTFINRQKQIKYGSIWDYIDPESRELLNSEQTDSLSEDEQARLEEIYLEGLVKWTREMILRRCRLILLKNLEFHQEVSFSPQQIQRAFAKAEESIRQWEPRLNGTELLIGAHDLWESVGKPTLAVISQELEYVGDTTFFTDLSIVSDLYQWEFDITKDLEDDEFDVRISLPGFVFYNNADEKSQDTLTWKFSGTDIFDEDVVLIADTIYVRWLPLVILAIVVLAIIILIFRKKPAAIPQIPLI